MLVGTPAYMAPEQVELKPVDARTDIYALGLLLYVMVTGSPAFEGERPIAVALKQLRELPRPPRDIAPALPAHAEAVILKCLQKDPGKRFQSVDDLTTALKRGAQSRPPVSLWDSFLTDFQRAGRDLHWTLQPWVEAADRFVKRQSWRVVTTKRARKALAAALGVACLLGGLATFSSSRRNVAAVPAPPRTSAVVAIGNLQSPLSETSVSDGDERFASQAPHSELRAFRVVGAPPIFTTNEVDLGPAAYLAAHLALGEDPSSGVVPPNEPPLSDSKLSRSKRNPRTHRAARLAISPLAAQHLPQSSSTPHIGLSAQAEVAMPASTASEEVSNKQVIQEMDATQERSESVFPVTPATSAEAKNEENTADPVPAAIPASSVSYLQVGSFKDSNWADQAVEKLTQLGFHAVSVRKSRLWMQSYQVRVGPYAEPKDLAAARQDLASQGFNPHSLK
jgi:serine/threonine protein kinase